jgi:hypothetical protein
LYTAKSICFGDGAKFAYSFTEVDASKLSIETCEQTISTQLSDTEELTNVSSAVGVLSVEEIPKQTLISATGVTSIVSKHFASGELLLQSQVIVAMMSVVRVYSQSNAD